MDLSATERKVDFVLQYLYRSASLLAQCHDTLGVPLEVLFNSATAKALTMSCAEEHTPKVADE